jgi:hypothetical protein
MTQAPRSVRARVDAHPFLARLSPGHRAMLARHATAASFREGVRIFEEGGRADHFWLLDTGPAPDARGQRIQRQPERGGPGRAAEGLVALDMRVPGRGDVVVETLPAGTVLGWSWLYPPYRWSFGAVARTRIDAIGFDAAAVRGQFLTDAGFGYAVIDCFTPVIIERLQATRLRMLDLYAPAAQTDRP